MSKRKTNDEFVKELNEVNPNVEPLEQYIDAFSKIKCRCKKCNNIWNGTPKEMTGKRRRGCPNCGNISKRTKQRMSNDDFLKKLINVHGNNIICVDIYINMSTKLRFKCNKDYTIWEQYPGHILKGHGCPTCSRNRKLSHEEYEHRLKSINPDIKMISKYKSMSNSIKVKCLIDGYEWETKPQHLVDSDIKRTGCPICSMSHGERKILDYLKNNNINYKYQKTYAGLYGVEGGLLSYDFYLIDYNKLIEYQGEYHDGSLVECGMQTEERFRIQQEHDRRKKEYAVNNGIELIEIWYWEFNDIDSILQKAV